MGKYSKSKIVIKNIEMAYSLLDEYTKAGGNRDARRKLGFTWDEVQLLERLVSRDKAKKDIGTTTTTTSSSLRKRIIINNKSSHLISNRTEVETMTHNENYDSTIVTTHE